MALKVYSKQQLLSARSIVVFFERNFQVQEIATVDPIYVSLVTLRDGAANARDCEGWRVNTNREKRNTKYN